MKAQSQNRGVSRKLVCESTLCSISHFALSSLPCVLMHAVEIIFWKARNDDNSFIYSFIIFPFFAISKIKRGELVWGPHAPMSTPGWSGGHVPPCPPWIHLCRETQGLNFICQRNELFRNNKTMKIKMPHWINYLTFACCNTKSNTTLISLSLLN